MGRLFGTNGVRGVVNKELTVTMVARLAASAGSILGKRIAVGRDGRTSSPMMRDAAVSGLLSAGCTVIDMGLLPTPTFQYSIKESGLSGGLMITASHNPPEFNGIKAMAGDGVEVPREMEDRIEEVYFKGGPDLATWEQVGNTVYMDVMGDYVRAVLSRVDVDAIREAGLAVALDPGNGVAALVAPRLARELGCRVFTLNAEIDGTFPGRDSEPRPDNLGGLCSLVKASGADVGVAFDGDGDRAIFVDETGRTQWGDRSFALVVREFMRRNPGSTIATPVSSSKAVSDMVEEFGGEVYWTRVGSVDVSRAMVEHGIELGGEENGGIMYGPHHPIRDGCMAMALILEIMAEEKKSLSALLSELPRYHQQKDSVPCPEERKQEALERLRSGVEAPRVETTDGVKLYYKDGSWILIRPSGTEPVFRLYAEADTPGRAHELLEEHKKSLSDVIRR